MKVSELMIGDWVMIRDYPTMPLRLQVRPEHFVRSLVEFEPIPLTSEILEKNGFKKAEQISDTPPYDEDVDGNKHYSLNGTFWGWYHPDGTFLIPANGMGWMINIKYVHELQHALRLCKIEKEIVL